MKKDKLDTESELPDPNGDLSSSTQLDVRGNLLP